MDKNRNHMCDVMLIAVMSNVLIVFTLRAECSLQYGGAPYAHLELFSQTKHEISAEVIHNSKKKKKKRVYAGKW